MRGSARPIERVAACVSVVSRHGLFHLSDLLRLLIHGSLQFRDQRLLLLGLIAALAQAGEITALAIGLSLIIQGNSPVV